MVFGVFSGTAKLYIQLFYNYLSLIIPTTVLEKSCTKYMNLYYTLIPPKPRLTGVQGCHFWEVFRVGSKIISYMHYSEFLWSICEQIFNQKLSQVCIILFCPIDTV